MERLAVHGRLHCIARRVRVLVPFQGNAAALAHAAQVQHQPIAVAAIPRRAGVAVDRRGGIARRRACRSEEHTSELQSLMRISYAVFSLKKNTPTHLPYP